MATIFGNLKATPWLPTAKDYVGSNLICQWDGIENVSLGGAHDSSATTWTDIRGGCPTLTPQSTGVTWADNACVFDGSGYLESGNITSGNLYEARTLGNLSMEVCYDITGYSQANLGGPFCIYRHNSVAFLLASFQVANGNNNPAVYQPYDNGTFNRIQISNVYNKCTVGYSFNPNGDFKVYINGTLYSTPSKVAVIGYDSWYLKTRIGKSSHNLMSGKVHEIRVFRSELCAEEFAANYAIDKVRFGL